MSNDQKYVGVIQNQDLTRLKDAPIGSMDMGNAKVPVILIAAPSAAYSLDKTGNLEEHLFPQSREEDPADISNTLTDIHLLKKVDRCPVTGRIIPELWEMERSIEGRLTIHNRLSTSSLSKSDVAEKLAGILRCYALRDGIPYAVNLFNLLSGQIQTNMTKERDANDQRRDDDGDSNSQCVREDSGAGAHDRNLVGNTAGATGGHDGGSNGGSGEGDEVSALPSRESDPIGGLSRQDLIAELKEQQLDLKAFSTSYEIIRQRVQTLKDEGRMMKLIDWSGTAAVMGSLELSIHAIERVVNEIRVLIKKVDSGEIPNTDGDRNV